MKRNVSNLSADVFDVLVIGAGIHGAAAAWAAAQRGLKVALVDQGDFGGATSANSLKVIHGGLRYLQHGDIRRMRESIAARSRFLRMAPGLVEPRQFLMPTFGHGVRSRAALRLALALNDAISADRNRGLRPDRRLPAGRMLSQAEWRRQMPAFDRAEITGAALWSDAFANSTERLTLAFVLTAAQAGAVAVNYVRVDGLRVEGGNVNGAEATDVLTGKTLTIHARTIVNAAGPWVDRIAPRAGSRWVKACNLVVRRQWLNEYGLALEGAMEFADPQAVVRRGKRNLFLVPWRGGTLIGTRYEFFADDPGHCGSSAAETAAFVDEINATQPSLALHPADITLVHAGILPALPHAAQAQPDKHGALFEHAKAGGPRGLLSIRSVKYTTGVLSGEAAALWVMRRLGRRAARVADELVAGTTPLDVSDKVNTPAIERAVTEEAACTLADVVMRRTTLGTFACPPEPALRECASIMARLLNWDVIRQQAEIDAVRNLYPTSNSNYGAGTA